MALCLAAGLPLLTSRATPSPPLQAGPTAAKTSPRRPRRPRPRGGTQTQGEGGCWGCATLCGLLAQCNHQRERGKQGASPRQPIRLTDWNDCKVHAGFGFDFLLLAGIGQTLCALIHGRPCMLPAVAVEISYDVCCAPACSHGPSKHMSPHMSPPVVQPQPQPVQAGAQLLRHRGGQEGGAGHLVRLMRCIRSCFAHRACSSGCCDTVGRSHLLQLARAGRRLHCVPALPSHSAAVSLLLLMPQGLPPAVGQG